MAMVYKMISMMWMDKVRMMVLKIHFKRILILAFLLTMMMIITMMEMVIVLMTTFVLMNINNTTSANTTSFCLN